MKPLMLLAFLAAGLLGASPLPSPSPAPTATPAITVVHISQFAFAPPSVTIHAGESVRWINDDAVQHSATADDASWDSGELAQGQSWTHVFAKAGTYGYYCDDHRFMKATVVVK